MSRVFGSLKGSLPKQNRSALEDILKQDFGQLNEDRLYGKRAPIEVALCAKEETLFSLKERIRLLRSDIDLTTCEAICATRL